MLLLVLLQVGKHTTRSVELGLLGSLHCSTAMQPAASPIFNSQAVSGSNAKQTAAAAAAHSLVAPNAVLQCLERCWCQKVVGQHLQERPQVGVELGVLLFGELVSGNGQRCTAEQALRKGGKVLLNLAEHLQACTTDKNAQRFNNLR